MFKKVIIIISCLTLCSRLQAADGNGHFTILPLGDSITQGGGNFTSYHYPLWKMLSEAGYDFEYVGPRTRTYHDIGTIHHSGYSGRKVQFFLPRIDTLYRNHPADIVLLHSGHNQKAEDKPVPAILDSYRTIIGTILGINPDATILVAQVIPSGKLPKYSYIPELNREIRKFVRSYHSGNVVLVNVAKHFDWEKHTIEDFVHPNAEGAQVMAEAWFKAIRKCLRQ